MSLPGAQNPHPNNTRPSRVHDHQLDRHSDRARAVLAHPGEGAHVPPRDQGGRARSQKEDRGHPRLEERVWHRRFHTRVHLVSKATSSSDDLEAGFVADIVRLSPRSPLRPGLAAESYQGIRLTFQPSLPSVFADPRTKPGSSSRTALIFRGDRLGVGPSLLRLSRPSTPTSADSTSVTDMRPALQNTEQSSRQGQSSSSPPRLFRVSLS